MFLIFFHRIINGIFHEFQLRLDRTTDSGFGRSFCDFGKGLLTFKITFRQSRISGQDPDNLPVFLFFFKFGQDTFYSDQFFQITRESVPGNGASVFRAELKLIDAILQNISLHFFFVMEINFIFPVADLEQRRLGDIEITPFHQLPHLTEEEGQQQGPDVGTVHIGIRHDDHLMVSQFADIIITLANTGTEGGNDHFDLFILQHLVETGFLHIKHFSTQRQDGLIFPVSALFGRTTG